MNSRRSPQPAAAPSSRGYVVFMVIFTITAVGIWLAINRDNIQEYRETYQSREQARQSIIETKATIGNLHRQQQSLNYNGHISQKQMRERMQMHYIGERVVYFEDEAPAAKTTSTASLEAEPGITGGE